MREMWIIFQRELKARVATKAFVIATILFPIVMLSFVAIPIMVSGNVSQRTLALVSEAPPAVTDRFIDHLNHRDDNQPQVENSQGQTSQREETRYRIERVEGTLAANEEQLQQRVLSKQLDGYIVLPADILTSNEIIYRARNISSMSVNRDLQIAANRAVQAQRLSEQGIEPDRLSTIIRPVQINSGQVTKDHAGKGSAVSSFAVAYGIAFLVYFTIITQGIGLLRSVLEEKTNRISEVMVSSVRPGYLMAGKILGAGSAAVIQVLSWVAMIAIALIVLSQGFFPPEVLSALSIDPLILLVLFLFFLVGFFLYAALYAAMGSMVNSEQEAQSIQSFGILPLVVPMLFMRQVIDDPLGKVATWLGMIPFTSPITMPLRIASETLPPLQIATSLALLVVGLIAVLWVTGRIYRIGILSTGKKPSFAELVQWIKAS